MLSFRTRDRRYDWPGLSAAPRTLRVDLPFDLELHKSPNHVGEIGAKGMVMLREERTN
jgi:hypothetical protein